jgi:hypothetical protein
MESVEIKLRGIDKSEFAVRYTKNIVEMLHEPQLSVEVDAGPIAEDLSKLLESLGYRIEAKKPMQGWVWLQAVKSSK